LDFQIPDKPPVSYVCMVPAPKTPVAEFDFHKAPEAPHSTLMAFLKSSTTGIDVWLVEVARI